MSTSSPMLAVNVFMELLASSVTLANVLLAFTVVLMAAAAHVKKTKSKEVASLPPGPPRFPIIGNLHKIAGSDVVLHQRLAELSREYGPVMQLQLGWIPTVVVSSRDAAQAFLKTHDLNFADRPSLMAVREMGYNCQDVIFAPYGDHRRTLKKLSVMELFTSKRVAAFRHIRDAAVSRVMDAAVSAGTKPLDLSKLFYLIGYWTVSHATFGNANMDKRLDNVTEIMEEIVVLGLGVDNLAEFFPNFESIISIVTGIKRKMRATFLKMDAVLDIIIKEHMASNASEQKDEDKDLLGLLLKHYRLQDLEFPLTMDNIKGVILDMFIAGTDTSSTTLEWAMAEMLKNPDIMRKAQSEVRQIYQEHGKMDESMVDHLLYLKLVVKETLRLHPPAPLLLPRQCRETIEVQGYQIPAKTRVFVNVWAIATDPEIWVKPNEFDPDRFQNRPLDYRGTYFEYLPFGSGRRMCPGATFGVASIEIILAKLLCHFDWKLPDGMGAEDLNMEPTTGLLVHKKVPLRVVATNILPF